MIARLMPAQIIKIRQKNIFKKPNMLTANIVQLKEEENNRAKEKK